MPFQNARQLQSFGKFTFSHAATHQFADRAHGPVAGGVADPQPLAARRRASAALPIGCGRQRTIGACDGRGAGLRAGAGAGRGGGSEFL